jgi:hypothetical protein
LAGGAPVKTIRFNNVTYTCALSEQFRRHTPEELSDMRADIALCLSVHVAVWVYKDVTLDLCNCVLDGEGRLTCAAALAGEGVKVDVQFRDAGRLTTDDAFQLAKSLNDRRRHDDPEAIRRRKAERIGRVVAARNEGKSLRAIAAEEQVSKTQIEVDLKEATVQGWTVAVPARITGLDGRSQPACRPPQQPDTEGAPNRDLKARSGSVFQTHSRSRTLFRFPPCPFRPPRGAARERIVGCRHTRTPNTPTSNYSKRSSPSRRSSRKRSTNPNQTRRFALTSCT